MTNYIKSNNYYHGKFKPLFKIIIPLIITLLVLPNGLFGQEESGPVIKKLVKEVHDNLQKMENIVSVLLAEKDASLSNLKFLQEDLENTDSEVASSEIMAEIAQELALLNNIDRKSVKIVKDAILALRPTLKSIQAEYETIYRMGHDSRAEFYKWRNDMGKMFQTSAKVLNRLKQSNLSIGSKEMIYNAESTIVLMLATLAQGSELKFSNKGQIANQISILDHAFNQLRNIEVLLYQEGIGIKMYTYNEIVNALIYILSKGSVTKIEDMPIAFQIGLEERSKVLYKLQDRRRKRDTNTLVSVNHDTHNQTISDLLNDKLPWPITSK